jgi:hypothetical protein
MVESPRRETRKVRVQLDLNDHEAAALDLLRDECRLRSRADAVKVALGVLEWVRLETAQQRKVLGVGDGMVSALVIPGVTTRYGGAEK